MNLPQFSVRRPVTTIMIFSAIILLGVMSLRLLPQELFPAVTYPQLTVVTTYENAAPEEIETQITRLVEESIGTVSNLKRIRSISKESVSVVIADFLWGTDMDFAALGVREKIDLIKERLPLDAEEPIVKKYNPFDLPVMTLSVTGKMSAARLRSVTQKYIEDELEKIEGVASAEIAGGIEREILVEIDQDKLQASGIPILDAVNAVRDANINYPAGTIKEVFTEYLIRTIGEFQDVSEIEKIPVSRDKLTKEEQGRFPQYSRQEKQPSTPDAKTIAEERLIFLRDVAQVKDTFKEVTSISRYNGKSNISVSIQKQAVANTMDVAEKIRSALKEIKKNITQDVEIEIVYDQSIFIKDSIAGVRDAALMGGIIAFFVLLVFLRSFRSSGIVTLSIPISIMFTFSLMYFSKVSLNIISLGGLALGVGLLVDSAIVVIENIFRHRQLGSASADAASEATEEVGGAIFASTLTNIVIFLPIIFVIGIVGQIFKDLAFTVTFSLLGSLLVALSLIPVLSMTARIKKAKRGKKGVMPAKAGTHGLDSRLRGNDRKRNSHTEDVAEAWVGPYTHLLHWFLSNKVLTLMVVLGIFLVSVLVFAVIDRELMPKVDQGQFIVNITMPTGTLLKVTDKVSRRIERVLYSVDEIENVSVRIGSTKKRTGEEAVQALGPHQGRIIVDLRERRRRSTQRVLQSLKESMESVDLESGELEYILQESMFETSFMGGSAPVVLEVKGEDLTMLRRYAVRIKRLISGIKGIRDVKTSLTPPSPETKAHIDKDKAATYGLSVTDIAQTSHIAVKGYVVTKFKEKGKEFDIKVRLRGEDRHNLAKLRQLLVHSPLGLDIPLSEVSYFSVGKGPSQIERLDQERTVLVTASIMDRGLDKVMADVKKALATLDLPEEYLVKLGGEGAEMRESFKSLMFALVIAVVLVYMIMASIFESLWQPFIIMFTLPLALIGVAWALLLTGTSLSVVALFGIIVLGGIAVNNGIVLIDYANLLRSGGMGAYDATIQASQTRLRPIMMTTLTTVLGQIPMAFSIIGPLAITVMGGLLVATFLTLVIIPILYFTVQSFFDKIRGTKA